MKKILFALFITVSAIASAQTDTPPKIHLTGGIYGTHETRAFSLGCSCSFTDVTGSGAYTPYSFGIESREDRTITITNTATMQEFFASPVFFGLTAPNNAAYNTAFYTSDLYHSIYIYTGASSGTLTIHNVGSASPEGAIIGNVGDIYIDTVAPQKYIKVIHSNATDGWQAF